MYNQRISKKYDEIVTVEDFKESVKIGWYKDWDGHGHPVKGDMFDPAVYIYPSKLNEIPPEATHIIWFNK